MVDRCWLVGAVDAIRVCNKWRNLSWDDSWSLSEIEGVGTIEQLFLVNLCGLIDGCSRVIVEVYGFIGIFCGLLFEVIDFDVCSYDRSIRVDGFVSFQAC